MSKKNKMDNIYSRIPLQVTLYDVSAGSPVRSYMFLGDIPQNVFDAANRGRPKSKDISNITKSTKWPDTKWSKSDENILSRYYGKNWKNILIPKINASVKPECLTEYEGGGKEEIDFGSLDDFDNEVILNDKLGDTELKPEEQSPSCKSYYSQVHSKKDIEDWDPRTIYVRELAFPEDTFTDIKSKIYAATGIPLYRQHLFYPSFTTHDDNEDKWNLPVYTTYKVTIDDSLILTDIRQFSKELCSDISHSDLNNIVAGIPVDHRMEERKEDVRIDALDSFSTLEDHNFISQIFVADINTLIEPNVDVIQQALSDNYQFDLLYYGTILKFWPILSPEAFRLAVSDPKSIAESFPFLYPPMEKVCGRLELERKLINKVYSQPKSQLNRRKREEEKGGIAVTETTVRVEPKVSKTIVNIRNILDWIPTGWKIPAIIGRLSLGETRKNHIIEKRHNSSYSSAYSTDINRFLNNPPKKIGVSFSIVRSAEDKKESIQIEFVYLTIYEDGRYSIKSKWRDDDRINFEDVIKQLSKATKPIIELINDMGAASLPLGGRLETPDEAANDINNRAKIGSLTVSSFWPHSLTSEGFREMKNRWRDYEKAGIVGVKGLQQAGAYTFLFRKGIVNYNPRSVEIQTNDVTNYYIYLTDPAAAQRWQYHFPGRIIHIYHRTTDIRVEFVNVNMDEFRRIQSYIFTFLDSLIYGPDKLSKGVILPGQTRQIDGRLRSLQERDPNLFDLKKYDEEATVYSKLCQGNRQPVVSSKPSKSSVKFWNFTKSHSAYYSCPSKKFPYLSFRSGEHPLGYCLPCCKKTKPLIGSKSYKINNLCLKKYKITEDDIVMGSDGESDFLITSRHVLSYGKNITIGRVSYPPRLITEELFYNSLPRKFVYRLVGVKQKTHSIPNAGFFYSLASTLSLSGEEFARKLSEAVIILRDTFYTIANGKAAMFSSAEELADTIINSFSLSNSSFTAFSPGGMVHNYWHEIIIDLVRIRFDIEVVQFIDKLGDGCVTLEASAEASTRLRESGELSELDVAVIITHPCGSYPFMAMNQRQFLRFPYGHGPARRFFSLNYGENDIKDNIIKIIRNMLIETDVRECNNHSFNLGFMTSFCKNAGHVIEYRLINLRDMCYGLIISPKWLDSGWVYFPIPYSPHSLHSPENIEHHSIALYDTRPKGYYPPEALHKFIKEINKSIGKKHINLKPSSRLINNNKELVGFIANIDCTNIDNVYGTNIVTNDIYLNYSAFQIGMFFHHDPVQESDHTKGLMWEEMPIASVPYDMRDIDDAIFKAGGIPQDPPQPEEKAILAKHGLYKHNLYRLFMAEFASILQDERNDKIRNKLKELFKRTKFNSAGSLIRFRKDINVILKDFPNDISTIRRIISNAYSRVGLINLYKSLINTFNVTSFDFDRITLNYLRQLGDKEKIEKELSHIMKAQVELENKKVEDLIQYTSDINDNSMSDILNMYVACSLPSKINRPHCIRERLRMPSNRFKPYISVLASDILNPLKNTTLGIMTSGVIDDMKFISRPGEHIIIS